LYSVRKGVCDKYADTGKLWKEDENTGTVVGLSFKKTFENVEKYLGR
jgi:hypothetical protein